MSSCSMMASAKLHTCSNNTNTPALSLCQCTHNLNNSSPRSPPHSPPHSPPPLSTLLWRSSARTQPVYAALYCCLCLHLGCRCRLHCCFSLLLCYPHLRLCCLLLLPLLEPLLLLIPHPLCPLLPLPHVTLQSETLPPHPAAAPAPTLHPCAALLAGLVPLLVSAHLALPPTLGLCCC